MYIITMFTFKSLMCNNLGQQVKLRVNCSKPIPNHVDKKRCIRHKAEAEVISGMYRRAIHFPWVGQELYRNKCTIYRCTYGFPCPPARRCRCLGAGSPAGRPGCHLSAIQGAQVCRQPWHSQPRTRSLFCSSTHYLGIGPSQV